MTPHRIFAAFACLVMPLSGTPAAQPADPGPARIAMQQMRVEDPGHAPIPMAIWAPAAGAGLPLVIISHGTGAGMAAHLDTAEALAGAGFVVVAPMYPGDNFQDQSIVGRPEWLAGRARHVGRVIDFMLDQWDGRARLAPDRVGIFGFSAGATTALISIGGVPELARIPTHCARNPEFVCELMAAPAAGEAAPVWTHDRRIAAAVLAAPGLGFAFAPESLAAIRVPVQLWSGDADRTVPEATNAGLIRRALPQPVEFHNVAGAVHLSFLAPCGPESPPAICQDGPGFDRAAFHHELNREIAAFFRRHLVETPSPRP